MANTHRWSIKLPSGNVKCEKCGMIRESVNGIGWKTVTLPTKRKVKKKYRRTYFNYKKGNNYIMDEVFPFMPTKLAPECTALTNEKEN